MNRAQKRQSELKISKRSAMKKKAVYVVTAGCYSDYRVVGIFSTKENATTYMDKFKKEYDDYNDLQAWTLDEHMSEIAKGLNFYRVIMEKDGTVRSIEESDHPCSCEGEIHWSMNAYWKPTTPWANFYCWAKDRKHAVKIANERRIMSLALPSINEQLLQDQAAQAAQDAE